MTCSVSVYFVANLNNCENGWRCRIRRKLNSTNVCKINSSTKLSFYVKARCDSAAAKCKVVLKPFLLFHSVCCMQCDQKKSPNVYKSCAKMISQEKWMTLTHLQKLPKNVRDLYKLIVSKGFKKLPKVQKIAQSGHTGCVSTAFTPPQLVWMNRRLMLWSA